MAEMIRHQLGVPGNVDPVIGVARVAVENARNLHEDHRQRKGGRFRQWLARGLPCREQRGVSVRHGRIVAVSFPPLADQVVQFTSHRR